MSIIKNNLKYLLYFIFFLLCLILFQNNNLDNMWNYGMAHAIRIGEVPYKDFNIISTPLYPIVMSLGLFIKDSYLVYLIEQSILCTILVFFLEKIMDKKYLILLPFLFFALGLLFCPSYNFFFFLLLIILLYFEKTKKSDYSIGILLGLLFITKHTMGCFIIFFSLLSTFNIKRMFNRLLFSFIPIIILILYWLITHSFYNFIDLSFLGLFDFGNKNKNSFVLGIIFSLIILIYCIYSIIRNKKDIYNYYLLGSFSFIIPMLDFSHLLFIIMLFFMIIFNKINIDDKYYKYIFVILFVVIMFFNISLRFSQIVNLKLNIGDKIKYFLVDDNGKDYYSSVMKKYKYYKNSYMITMSSVIFDIEANHKINYFDVPLYGNFGGNGLSKMINKINNMHDVYFFVCDSDNRQFAKELVDNIRKKGHLVEIVHGVEIYYFN